MASKVGKVIGCVLGTLLAAGVRWAATGPQRTEVVLANFADRALDSACTPAYIADRIFVDYNGWIQAESHGLESFPGSTANVHQITLPHATSYYCTIGGNPPLPLSCNRALILSDAQALTAFTWSEQDLIPVLFPDAPICLAGGNVYTCGCHPSAGVPPGAKEVGAAIHEGGHVQGRLSHANMYYCADGRDIGAAYDYDHFFTEPGCVWWEYANKVDPMGAQFDYDPAQRALQHYSMPYQVILGWKQPSNTQMVWESGQVTLTDMRLATSAVQEARIPLPDVGDGYTHAYSIEYRPDVGVLINITFDRDLSGIHSVSTVNGQTWPPTITAANPFLDPYRGIAVRFVSSNASTATVDVEIGDGGGEPGCRGQKCPQ